MIRTAIAIVCLILAFVLVESVSYGHFRDRWPDLALNLGSEFAGIVVTVLVVDWLMERRSLRDEMRRTALNALHDVDHAVWVWQGGAREFDVAELDALLAKVQDSDPMPDFTQNLLLNIGTRASNTLRTRSSDLRAAPVLRHALQLLSPLSTIRDRPAQPNSSTVAKCMRDALQPLCEAASVAFSRSDGLPPVGFRDTDVSEQEWRHYGWTRRQRAAN